MEFIEKILIESSKKKVKFIIMFVYIIAIMVLFALLEKLKVEGLIAVIIVIVLIINYILIQNLIPKYLKKSKKIKEKIYKVLDEKGYKKEFTDTIDNEIKSKNALKYYEDICKAGLVITDTWFVFISSNKIIIRKRSEVSKISEKFWPELSKYLFTIDFKDNSSFSTKQIDYEEIKKKIKDKYPDLI